jgi:hypothetical protein
VEPDGTVVDLRERISGVFQPNAPTKGELRSFAGLRARQLLKARSQFVGERVRLDLSSSSVSLWLLGPLGITVRRVGEWPATDVRAVRIEANGVRDSDWPAMRLLHLPSGRFIAELRAVRDASREREVLRRLESPPAVAVARRT